MPDNNLPTSRPMLKKVKRPISRMPQQPVSNVQPNSIAQNVQPAQEHSTPIQNPFNTNRGLSAEEAKNNENFNLNSILDDDFLPTLNNVKTDNNKPAFLEDEDEISPLYNKKSQPQLPEYLTKNTLIILAIVLLFIGMLCGKFLFTESKVVRNGLQGVVLNPEVPKGRARCGVAERSQGCVLYVMNPQRQELNARDFYDLASQMTGRQRFVIETGNMRYSNAKIRPGDIAQLNIPPL